MFELFVVIILVLVVRMFIIKAKSFYKTKKEHRKIMKLFEQEKVPVKVKWGLKRFFRRSKFKPNRATKESLGLLKYPKAKRVSRIAQVNFICLPILFMWDYGLFLIPIIIGAVEMFDWTADIRKLPPCCRPLVRNNNGYWFCAMIKDDDADVYIIESRDDGVSWGSNHANYNDNIAFEFTTVGCARLEPGANYTCVSLAITDDNIIHLFAVMDDSRQKAYIRKRDGSNADITDCVEWLGYDVVGGDTPFEAIGGGANFPHSGTIVTNGNDPHLIWSQRVDWETNKYEIKFRYYDTVGAAWSAIKDVTASSADNNYYPCLGVDSNSYFHTTWRNDNGDNSIKYGHTHDRAAAPWKQSDDASNITTGESGETIMTEAGKDFDIPSLCINALPDKLDDVWASGYLSDDDELYATQYDKSAATWQAKAKFSAADLVDANGQLGVTADGKIHALWSIKTVGGIRHSEYDVSWSAPETLQT